MINRRGFIQGLASLIAAQMDWKEPKGKDE